MTVVVTPLECQSKPRTQPNAWNQYGSERRRSTSSLPYSCTMFAVISRARRTMREKSHAGAVPPCSGRWADPVRTRSIVDPDFATGGQENGRPRIEVFRMIQAATLLTIRVHSWPPRLLTSVES